MLLVINFLKRLFTFYSLFGAHFGRLRGRTDDSVLCTVLLRLFIYSATKIAIAKHECEYGNKEAIPVIRGIVSRAECLLTTSPCVEHFPYNPLSRSPVTTAWRKTKHSTQTCI